MQCEGKTVLEIGSNRCKESKQFSVLCVPLSACFNTNISQHSTSIIKPEYDISRDKKHSDFENGI